MVEKDDLIYEDIKDLKRIIESFDKRLDDLEKSKSNFLLIASLIGFIIMALTNFIGNSTNFHF